MSEDLKCLEFMCMASPSLNQLNGRWSKLNWKKKYLKQLKRYNIPYRLKSKKKMRVTYHRYGSRQLDITNLTGGIKPLEDAIKELGMIVDDSPAWVENVYLQSKCKRGEEKMIVRIEEI